MRRAMTQWLLVGFALVWGASGCNCGEPPVESELTVAFERPTDGQRLALDDDADPLTDGFQYEVVALARDTADRAVTLASAKLEVRGPSEQEWRAGPEAVIDGASVRFPGTLLEARTNLLQVTVEEEGSRRTATLRISVTVSTEPPSVDLTQPAEGQVLREVDDADPETPGYQLRFAVKSVGLAGKAGTIYCEEACGVPPTDFTVNSSGLTQVTATLSQAAACEAQQAACYAVVRNGEKEVSSGRRNILLDTVAPRVEVVSPVAPVSTTTFTVEATVGCSEPGVTATLSREGVADLSAQVVAGGVTFPSVTVPTDGEYTFTLRVADEGGNVTTRQLPVTVASTVPTVRLLVSRTVTSDADGSLEGVQVPVTVQADRVPVGTEVRLFTNASGARVRPQVAVTAGINREASFTANLAEGANTVRACVSNAAGIEQCATEPVTVSVGPPGCRISLRKEETGDVPFEDGVLLSKSPPEVRVDSGDGSVILKLLGTSTEVTRTASSGSARLPLDPLADGEHRLVANCPGGATSQVLSFGVDTTVPALSFDVHGAPAGQTVLGPELNDTSLAPGMQISLDVRTDPRATVLASGCGGAGVSGKADAAGALLLRGVSVPPSGTCELQVSSEDLAGNITVQKRTLTLAFTDSELRFVSPEAGRYLGPADGTVRTEGGLLVAVKLEVTPATAGTLRLLRGATEIASLPVAPGDTEKTFTDVALEEGSNVLRAELVGPNGTVACATVLLLVETQPGTIALLVPTSSPDPFRVSADLSPEVPGLQANLQYSVTNRSPGAVVDICTSRALVPGAAPCRDASGWFTLATDLEPLTPRFTYPEGRYGLKAVLEDGTISVSQEVTLTVDSIEPAVRAVELLGDTNGDRRLNAAELPSGAPLLRVTADGLEDGSPVQVRRKGNRNLIYGQATVSGGQATVSLDAMQPGVADDYELVVTVTDAAGNSNRVEGETTYHPLNTAAFFQFRLDRVAPGLVVSSPTRTALGIADDADTVADDFQLRGTVNTDEDVGTGGVHMELTPGGGTVELTPSEEREASHDFTLSAPGTVTYTLTMSAVDVSGNRSAPVVRSITVDREAPTVDLVTPAAGPPYATTEVPVRVDVGGGDVASVRLFTLLDGADAPVVVGDLQVVAGVAQGTLNFPAGVQTVSVQASDAAGNLASDSVAGVDVRQPGCAITLTTPSDAVVKLLAKDDRDPSTPGLQYRLSGNTLACRGRTVTLYRGSPPGAPEATTPADATTGDFFFDVTLQHGDSTVFTVEVFNASSERSIDSVDVTTVDLVPPAITAISPAGTTLFFVASTNAFLLPTPSPDRVVDTSPGGDANATFTLTVTEAAGGTVQAFYRGTPVSVASPVPSSTPASTLPIEVTLPHDTTGTLELRVQDPSGNVVLHTVAATVDVIPPAAPTVTRTLVAGQERAARVNVTWTASGDDGLSGMPAGYDLRWTVKAQLKDGIKDKETFFGPRVRRETGGLLPATATSHVLTLPPLSNYSIQLRPTDEVGNLPPFQAETSLLENYWTSAILGNPASGNSFGQYISSRGDLNADGFDDLVVGASTGTNVPGAVYVYYGASNPQAVTPQYLTRPETEAEFYGSDFDVGDVGNATTDKVQDLLVGSRGYSSTSGRAFLYFGRKGTTVDEAGPIEFRHATPISGASLGGAAKMIGDITGDGLQELVLSSHGENPPRVYLFYGRSPDAWRSLGSSCSASAPCIVPASSADKIFTAPAGTLFFGRNRGYVRLGDITGDQVADFTIPSSHESQNKVYVYSGATVRSLPGKNVALTDALQVVSRPPGASATNGFGTEATGGVNLAGSSGLDLVVSMASENKVLVYPDGSASGFTAAPLVIQGASRFGYSLARGDLNGDGRPDIAVGQNVGSGSAFVFYNQGVPGAEFDTLQEAGFFQSKLETTVSTVSLTILDFNGDGRQDLAVLDNRSGVASVVVYY